MAGGIDEAVLRKKDGYLQQLKRALYGADAVPALRIGGQVFRQRIERSLLQMIQIEGYRVREAFYLRQPIVNIDGDLSVGSAEGINGPVF